LVQYASVVFNPLPLLGLPLVMLLLVGWMLLLRMLLRVL
jgi:hypothetical protein